MRETETEREGRELNIERHRDKERRQGVKDRETEGTK